MINLGLKGVVVLETTISRVDGEKGILEYRGYNIHDLASHCSFEEVTYLLWYGCLPTKKQLEDFKEDLAKRRELPSEIIGLLETLPKFTHPMVILRTAISYLGSLDKKLHEINPEENLEKAKDLLVKIPMIMAYYHRIREGKSLIHPKKSLDQASNFLWMMNGKKLSRIERKALNLDMVLHAEHDLSASTFSARIAASTLSDMYAGVVSATGVLMGPLHGGAAQKVIEMLRELKGKDLEKWVKGKLSRGEKIMGFGHRVYQKQDPRAKELKKLAKKLGRLKGTSWISLAEKLAKIVKKQKNLNPNVDFYAAPVYANLGIPDDFFVNVFAMSRIAGLAAHLMEQYQENKLIRPLSKYVGETNKLSKTFSLR